MSMIMQRPSYQYASVILLLLLLCSDRPASGKVEKAPPEGGHAPPPPPPASGAGGSAAAASMNTAELEAVFQVMESLLDVPNFRRVHPRPCSQDLLPGVILCEQGAADRWLHVTRLQLGSGVRQHCKLGATIPGAALAQLPYLRTLLISECVMSQRSAIPPQLPASLQELSLRSNKALMGSIPAALGRLKNLQVLSLAQNNLQGSIPAELADLKMLEQLDLSYNVLSGKIPPVLGHLPSLSILDLSGNLLQGAIPTSFHNAQALQKLDLSGNQLSGAIPPELGSLRSLQFLALSQNGFKGPLPASMAALSSLQYFLMDANPLRSPLPSYTLSGSWPQLRELSLAGSSLTGPLPSELNFHSLSNLSVINLSNNDLEGSISPSLEQKNQQLSYLNLSQNFLTGAVPFSARFIQKLGNRLDLHGNPALCVSAAAVGFSDQFLTAQQLRPCRDGDHSAQLGTKSPARRNGSSSSPRPPSAFVHLLIITAGLGLFLSLLSCY